MRIGTCANPVDGAFVRSMFEARGVRCVIGGEHHAALLGPIQGAFLTLDIWVASEDAEEASALLRDLRETKVEDAPDPRAALDDDELADLDGDGEWVARAHALTAQAAVDERALQRAERGELDAMRGRAFRRRRAIIGMLLPFGAGHLLSGAPLRGMLLAAIAILGFLHGVAGHLVGWVAFAGVIAADLGGTAYRLHTEESLK